MGMMRPDSRQGNEVTRSTRPKLPAVPAQQGFKAGKLSGRAVHQRLIVQFELLVFQGVTQCA